MGEDAFQDDTMPSGVRETIKLWTQPGTSSESTVGVIYRRGGSGGECIGGDDKRILSLSGGERAIVLWHCAHEDPSQQSFQSSVLTLIHYHH